jgi:GAF domain-containing protein
VIAALARGPDLDRILPGVVELLSDATGCHACFIYMLEGERLRMRAASEVYSHVVGRIEMSLDEGLCGWVARNREPAFIREEAIADPRTKVFPELDEERFQSVIAVPVTIPVERVIGVVVLHTEAPREFDPDVVEFLVNVASMAAGAIHNARLFDEARLRAKRLAALAELGQRIAAAGIREELYEVICEGAAELVGGEAARLLLADGAAGRLDVVATAGAWADDGGPAPLLPADPGLPEISTGVAAGSEELGVLSVVRDAGSFSAEDARLLQSVGSQLAVALQRVELIERLTGENLVRDLFEALAEGRFAAAESRARAARHDLSQRSALVIVRPAPERAEDFAAAADHVGARLRRLVPGALIDDHGEALRALVPLGLRRPDAALASLDAELATLARDERLAIGRGTPFAGLVEGARGLVEAVHAARVTAALHPAGGAKAYDSLGVYRYLDRGPGGPSPDSRLASAINVLREYDGRRGAALVPTLERYLESRGSPAAAARDLYIHPNTLRQRLGRIEQLTDLDLSEEDLLSLELALKLAPLRSEA